MTQTIKQKTEVLGRLNNNPNGFLYRFSRCDDIELVNELLKLCFGDRSEYGALDHLDNRYLLVFGKGKLIAMTGIDSAQNSPFTGDEIDWTCCDPEYRRLGIITGALSALLQLNTSKTVFCSCYRQPGKEKANLHNIMMRLGFQCELYGYKAFDQHYFKACSVCNFKCKGQCSCHEDLYVLCR